MFEKNRVSNNPRAKGLAAATLIARCPQARCWGGGPCAAGLGVDLRQFELRLRHDVAAFIEDDAAGAGGALVECEQFGPNLESRPLKARSRCQRPPRKGRQAAEAALRLWALAVSPFPNCNAIREKGEGAKRLRGMHSIFQAATVQITPASCSRAGKGSGGGASVNSRPI
eukprot:gene38511-47557_t